MKDNDICYLLPVSSKPIKLSNKLTRDIEFIIFEKHNFFKKTKNLHERISKLNKLALTIVQDKDKNYNKQLTKNDVEKFINNLVDEAREIEENELELDLDFD